MNLIKSLKIGTVFQKLLLILKQKNLKIGMKKKMVNGKHQLLQILNIKGSGFKKKFQIQNIKENGKDLKFQIQIIKN